MRRRYSKADIVFWCLVTVLVVGIFGLIVYETLTPQSPEEISRQNRFEKACESLSILKKATRFEVIGDLICVLYFCEYYDFDGMTVEGECTKQEFQMIVET